MVGETERGAEYNQRVIRVGVAGMQSSRRGFSLCNIQLQIYLDPLGIEFCYFHSLLSLPMEDLFPLVHPFLPPPPQPPPKKIKKKKKNTKAYSTNNKKKNNMRHSKI